MTDSVGEERKLESHSNLEEESSSRRSSPERNYSSFPETLRIKRKTTTTPAKEISRLPLRNLNDNNNKIAGSFKDCAMKEKFRAAGTWVRTTAGATIVEPEFLGPCEPGTSIVLEGVVWNETKNGVLVVNVTWRGKSYIGTLVDCSKSEWSTPRFCDSPNAQDDVTNRGGGRKLKRNNNSHSNLNFATSSTKSPAIEAPATGVNKNDDFVEKSPNRAVLEPSSPALMPCPFPRCGKKFAAPVALIYHQSGAHDGAAMPGDFRDAATSTAGDFSRRNVDVQTENDVDVGKKALSDRENASLENLFKIVTPDAPSAAKKRRPPSPAFSDVSDADEAPTLERHMTSPPEKTPPKKKKEQPPETFLAAPLLPYDAIFAAAAQSPSAFFAPPQPPPKKDKTPDAANGDVKSPPVHRHLHTHHHTHAYPTLLTSVAAAAVDPYVALLAAGQQAAAAAAVGIVGAYPPYAPG